MKETHMKYFYLVVTCLLFTPLGTYCNRIPDIIGEFTQRPHYAYWASCIGDQNGDGRADLIVPNYVGNDFFGLDIYFGRARMNDQPDVHIPINRDESERFFEVGWIGSVSENHRNTFVAAVLIRENTNYHVDFYDNVVNENLNAWESWGPVEIIDRWKRFQNKPFDFNGDGYDDFICCQGDRHELGYINIFYGGNDFDSIPDWSKTYAAPSFIENFIFSCGYDVNADGYDDIFVNGQANHEDIGQRDFYAIYLGGAEPDTNPAVLFWDREFDGVQFPIVMDCGFSLLQDINNDGYDDFGVYYQDFYRIPEQDIRYEWDGIYLFFGSEQLDSEPDLTMAGAQLGQAGVGYFVGGDFNGDGIGDICANYTASAPGGNNEIQFHFGSSHLDTIPDLVFSGADVNHRVGSLGRPSNVADYNGDGIDDVVVKCSGGEDRLVVFMGDRNWHADVNSEPEFTPSKLDLSFSPNPFNNVLTINYQVEKAGRYAIDVFDVTGRKIKSLDRNFHYPGQYNLTWESTVSGVYLVCLNSGKSNVVRKAVCLP